MSRGLCDPSGCYINKEASLGPLTDTDRDLNLIRRALLSLHLPTKASTNLDCTAMTDRELHDLVGGLPNELYDEIFNLTFDPTAPTTILIERGQTGRPISLPPILRNLTQISFSIRLAFATSYYSNSTFIVRDLELCLQWLDTIPPEHKCLLRTILCHAPSRSQLHLPS